MGLVAGTILGVAAGLFLQSKKGKQATKDLMKKSASLQAKLMKEVGKAENLTKEKYEKIVDQIMAYYAASREVAKTEVPEIRAFLLSKWASINNQIKAAKK